MALYLLLVMLTACAAIQQDLSGKMFTFPQQTNTAQVRLTPSIQVLKAATVCLRSFTDLSRAHNLFSVDNEVLIFKMGVGFELWIRGNRVDLRWQQWRMMSFTDLRRDHALFSMATSSNANAFLIYWEQTNKELEVFIKDTKSEFVGLDYKPNIWHSICTTWDSTSGLVQLWFDGQPLVRKYATSGSNISGPIIIVLGQEQDSHGGGFDINQSFVGMMTDVHLWDRTLSPCEIQTYADHLNFPRGNVLNWGALEFQTTGRVLIEDDQNTCY